MERKVEEISQELEQNTKEGENRKEKNCSVKELHLNDRCFRNRRERREEETIKEFKKMS